MDPISHALLGRVLVKAQRAQRARRDPAPRGCVAAAMLGSLAPDIDFALTPFGWDRYLAVHLTGTHTVLASPVLALGCAGIVRLFTHTPMRPMVISAWLGVVIGHLLFDLVSGSDMALFAPFSSIRLAPHLIAMADLLALVVLVAGTIASRWRPRPAAAATLVALVALLGLKAVSQQRAMSVARESLRAAGLPVTLGHPEAVNGSFTRWQVFGRLGNAITAWHVDGVRGDVRVEFSRDMASGPLVEASRNADVVRRFLNVADTPVAMIEHLPDGTLVTWSDIRYCDATMCPLTFGVVFDATNVPLRQLIRIGPIEQTRPMN